MTHKIGEPLTKNFADAHELAYIDGAGSNDSNLDIKYGGGFTAARPSEMDFYYNRLGRQVGLSLPNASVEDLAKAVWQAVLSDISYVINPLHHK